MTVRRDFPLRDGERFGAWAWSDVHGARNRSPQRWRAPSGTLAPGTTLAADNPFSIIGWGIGSASVRSTGGTFTTNHQHPIAAEVQLVSSDGRVQQTAPTRGPDGEAELDTTGMSGSYVIRIVPEAQTTDVAGPNMSLPHPIPPLAYLQANVNVELRDGLLNGVHDPYDPVDGHVTARVGNRIAHDPVSDHLPLSLKPVWWQHPGTSDRDPDVTVDLIIVHCTSGARLGNALNQWFGHNNGAHYTIDIDGHVIKLASEDRKVPSVARGWDRWERNIHSIDPNDRSIGIEIINPISFGPRDIYADFMASDEPQPYTSEQYRTSGGTGVIPLLESLTAAYPEIRHRIIGHSDVACGREVADQYGTRRDWDPGERFDWSRVQQAGLGMIPEGVSEPLYDRVFETFPGVELQSGDRDPSSGQARYGGTNRGPFSGQPIQAIQNDLRTIGYSLRYANGRFDEWTAGAVDRFRRHFEQARGDRITESTARVIRGVANQVRAAHDEQGYSSSG